MKESTKFVTNESTTETKTKTKPGKTIVRLLTALSFALFTAYQLVLAFQIDSQRVGRLIGIGFYALITAASFLALVHKPGVRILRSVLFIAGFFSLFVMRLLNAPRIFSTLDFNSVPIMLNAAVYIISQLGTLLLLFYYTAVRIKKSLKHKRAFTMVLMSLAIVMFVSCLMMELTLITQYKMNIELNARLTILSRFLYCFGYVGTAVSFMLPSTKGLSETEQYINKEQSEADTLVNSPHQERPRSDGDKKRSPVFDDSSLVFSAQRDDHSHADKDKEKRNPVVSDSDIIFTAPTRSSSHSDRDKKRTRAFDDDIIVSAPKSGSHREKPKKTALDDADIVFSTHERSNKHKRYREKPPQ